MIYIVLIIISISILICFGIIISDIKKGKYIIGTNKSILSVEAEEKYLREFSKRNIKDLKIEIEKIADMLINGDESNRYTESLRQKAKKDQNIALLKDAVTENVELIKYAGDFLKARIKYKDYNHTYSLILSMSTVTEGRVFLDNYFTFLGTDTRSKKEN